MAKGDSTRSQNQIDLQGKIAQYGTGGGNVGLTGLQNQFNQQNDVNEPAYRSAVTGAQQDYGNIMGGYNNFMSGLGGQQAAINGITSGLQGGGGAGLINQDQVNSAMGGYQKFADTGGYTPEDISAFHEQSMAPIRGAYGMAQAQLQQNRGLSGGYSPNYAAASSQMARQSGQQLANAQIGSNAAIANLVQQGKLAGLGGLSQTALQNQAEGLQAAAINNQYKLGAAGLGLQGFQIGNQAALGGLGGQRDLYGTTSGSAGLAGNMLNQNQQNQLNAQGLQNQLGIGLMGAQNQKAQLPSLWTTAMNNINTGSQAFKNIAGGFAGF